MLVIALSGPAAGRAPLLGKLSRVGVGIDASPERGFNPSHGLPRDEETEWITCHADSLALVERALAGSEWGLRLHYEKPEPRAAERDLLAEIDELRRSVTRLENASGARS